MRKLADAERVPRDKKCGWCDHGVNLHNVFIPDAVGNTAWDTETACSLSVCGCREFTTRLRPPAILPSDEAHNKKWVTDQLNKSVSSSHSRGHLHWPIDDQSGVLPDGATPMTREEYRENHGV